MIESSTKINDKISQSNHSSMIEPSTKINDKITKLNHSSMIEPSTKINNKFTAINNKTMELIQKISSSMSDTKTHTVTENLLCKNTTQSLPTLTSSSIIETPSERKKKNNTQTIKGNENEMRRRYKRKGKSLFVMKKEENL